MGLPQQYVLSPVGNRHNCHYYWHDQDPLREPQHDIEEKPHQAEKKVSLPNGVIASWHHAEWKKIPKIHKKMREWVVLKI